MKIFGVSIRDYATLPKLKSFLTKELSKHGYNVRDNDNASFIIASDRADLISVSFKVYAQSFDMWVLDAFGIQQCPVVSYRGAEWRKFMKRQMRHILYTLEHTHIKDGHVINTRWQEMMREIAYPQPVDGTMLYTINMAVCLNDILR